MSDPMVFEISDDGEVEALAVGDAIVVEGVQIPAAPGARKLDDLTDVEGATAALSGRVLIKALDGIWRPGVVSGGGGIDPLVWSQPTPSGTWAIEHNLGRYPQVTVLDIDGTRMFPDLDYVSLNAVTITHAEPLAGTAILT